MEVERSWVRRVRRGHPNGIFRGRATRHKIKPVDAGDESFCKKNSNAAKIISNAEL
jgi:hypothetical protein